MKTNVLILVDELKSAGAESLAIDIALKLKVSTRYTPLVCATRCGGELEGKLRANQIEYFVMHRDGLYKLHSFSLLRKIFRDHNIQIIHAHKIGSSFWGGILGKLRNVPVVIAHFHGKSPGWKTSVAETIAARLCHKIVTVSECETQRLVHQEGIPPHKVMTIYNGIELAKYKNGSKVDLKSQFRVPVGNPVVGILAELRAEKNHDVFLLAASEVLKEKRNVYFLIIGDGERRTALENRAAELGIARNCIFTGFIKNVPDILSIIDIGVLSSTREALPLALLEYMACGKPMVATSVGGIPEIVEDGINGFLIRPGEASALAQKIKLLVDDKSLAVKMGRNGLLIAEQKFSDAVMMKKIENLYGETLVN